MLRLSKKHPHEDSIEAYVCSCICWLATCIACPCPCDHLPGLVDETSNVSSVEYQARLNETAATRTYG
jgi:hypothetical protein